MSQERPKAASPAAAHPAAIIHIPSGPVWPLVDLLTTNTAPSGSPVICPSDIIGRSAR